MKNLKNERLVTDELVLNKIYFIREQKVMLDEDLAVLYGVSTKRLNEQVSRNSSRFPKDFMFKLTDQEYETLRSQFATSKKGGRRYLPNVFTEHGVLMLSSILNSQQAIEVNIQIMRIFTRIRQTFLNNTELRLEIEKIKIKLDNQDKNMETVFRYLDGWIEKNTESKPWKRIGYKSDNI